MSSFVLSGDFVLMSTVRAAEAVDLGRCITRAEPRDAGAILERNRRLFPPILFQMGGKGEPLMILAKPKG